jgi:hypothetical protein
MSTVVRPLASRRRDAEEITEGDMSEVPPLVSTRACAPPFATGTGAPCRGVAFSGTKTLASSSAERTDVVVVPTPPFSR